MKKFGLRALAGGMAALMVASVFAPASVANAADVLLIAPAPTSEKVLYVTEDMVDEDGEIVISGGTYDRVVVSKEAAANDIYFDQVEIGDLVVESGSKSNIQLWEVDAEKLTVKEPELENITLSDLRTLLTDDATRQKALDLFVESQAKDARTLKNAPKIVTKEDAKVETLVARANAKLDLGEGEVGVVALEASNELRRADVTLSNYNGDVTYKGGDAYSVMNLKNVDSRIKSLTVEESTAVNHLNVTAKNAVVLEATVSGNAKVSLNAPMGTVEITEDATEADVCIFNAAEELNVKADGAKVELAPNGSVVLAKVTSDDVKITGKGSLTEADLDGKGAYVTISGAKVDGENTYVPPVYVPPVEEPYDSWSEDFSDAELVSGVPTDGASMNWATYRYDAEGGYGVATTKDGWEGFAVLLDNRDNGSYADYVVTLKAKKLGGVTSAVRVSENLPDNSWPAHAAVTTIGEEWVTIKTNKINVAAGEKRIILIVPENGASGVTMELAVDDIKVERYTEWTVAKGPEISTETYTVAETFTKNAGSFKARGTATATVKEGALYVSGRTANWHGVEISLNKEKTIGRTLNVSFKVKYDDDTAGTVKSTLNTSSSAYTPVTETAIAKEDGWITVTETMTVPADAEYVTYYFEAVSTTASFYIDDVVISTEEITEDMLTEPEGGDDNQGGNEVTAPADGTACVSDGANVVHSFDSEDLRNYAGNTVTISVSVCKRGDAEVAVHLQTGDPYYAGVAGNSSWNQPITDDWTTYTCDFLVPEEWKDAANPVNFGLRMCRDDNGAGPLLYDYAACDFYYKDFSIVKRGAEEKITEFYIAKDVAFREEVINSNGNIVAQLEALNLAGDNLVNLLPAALAGDAANYKTLEGIMSKVNYFEFSVTLTEGTPKEGLQDGIYWAPQAQIQAQSTNYSEGTWSLGLTQEQNATLCANLGQATESNPKTGTGKLFTEYFEGWTSKDQYTLNMLQLQFLNAELGTYVSGTYSIKAVLK